MEGDQYMDFFPKNLLVGIYKRADSTKRSSMGEQSWTLTLCDSN